MYFFVVSQYDKIGVDLYFVPCSNVWITPCPTGGFEWAFWLSQFDVASPGSFSSSTPETIYHLVVFLFTVHLSSSTQRKNFLVFLLFIISALCAFYFVTGLEHVYCQQVITLTMRFCQAGVIFRLLNFCVRK